MLRSKRIVASGGSYSVTGQAATIRKTKYLVANGGSYTYTGQSAVLLKNRRLIVLGGSYTYSGSNSTYKLILGGGYPSPADVLLGINYGPTGTEYTGTLDIGQKYRFDISTGNLVMILDAKKVMTL
jgi:hypothetical protein